MTQLRKKSKQATISFKRVSFTGEVSQKSCQINERAVGTALVSSFIISILIGTVNEEIEKLMAPISILILFSTPLSLGFIKVCKQSGEKKQESIEVGDEKEPINNEIESGEGRISRKNTEDEALNGFSASDDDSDSSHTRTRKSTV